MDNTQIKQDIDNININVETPSDDSDTNLQELERDNWGRILNNKTFLHSELCFKMNLSGARNNLSIYNTVSKTTTYADTYTVFYMTNTMDLFEGDFTTVNIEFEIRDVKVLLKV